MTVPGAVDALQALARTEAQVAPGFRHVEVFTMGGLLTLLWHEPTDGTRPRAAVVAGGGAMGGLLGPGDGLYHRLGVVLAHSGVAMVRVGYRRPNDLDRCSHDLAAAVEMVVADGAERVVTMGHSFGGAVAVRAGVVMPEVAGVVTFATQSAGCEMAAALGGRPLLLFHGDRDQLLPVEASEMVRAMAGGGELVVLPGADHLLSGHDDAILERLDPWLADVLQTSVLQTDETG